MERRKVI